MSIDHQFIQMQKSVHASTLVVFVSSQEPMQIFASAPGIREDILRTKLQRIGFHAKLNQVCTIDADPLFAQSSFSNVVCVGLGAEFSKLTCEKISSCAAKILHTLGSMQIMDAAISGLETALPQLDPMQLHQALLDGINYANYKFHGYKQKEQECASKLKTVYHYTDDITAAQNCLDYHSAKHAGVAWAKDLMHMPGNILTPTTFATAMSRLSKLGVVVKILDENDLKTERMHALLSVGQGSTQESRLVSMLWPGSKENTQKPVAIVGKGICYDSGGINIKLRMLTDMKYDMGGAAAVVGTMLALAENKCEQAVVGVIALAENMPDGNAIRPSDVIQSRQGKSIEVLNTDAEGRLILADAIDYTIDYFKPRWIIDLATLTGAMIVSLGHEYAGYFSNSAELSQALEAASEHSGEKLWRLPLDPAYDAMIDSPIADVQNLGSSPGAGSIVAAQFLQRFCKDTAWAHIDIAGTAWTPKHALHGKGPTGYGVALLQSLIESAH